MSQMSHQEKKCPIRRKKHINSLQSLNDAIHWSSSTLNVPSGEKNGNTSILQHINSPILERCHPIRRKTRSPSTLNNVPSGEKSRNTSILSILERCHPLESSTLNVPSGEKNGNTSILSNP
ncbi:hypothetical protein TNCV_3940301 [Trichonephila clavipes]|uniref:Uncharacterized protein n=1 Tax=Trichonephila clavipes TaxID=2585209 RepID=A0A8X6VVR9_TRICX|nr:hypothetical protein TNCV_3940301 [Trichonephila clavipes]